MSTDQQNPAALKGQMGNIKKEINRKDERRQELREELDAVAEKVDAAETALVDGEGTVEDVEEHRQRWETLQGVVEHVEGQLEALRADLEAAEAEYERAAVVQELEALAERAATLHGRRNECKAELAETLETLSADYVEATAERNEVSRAFRETAKKLEVEPKALVDLLEDRGCNLVGVLPHYAGRLTAWPQAREEGPDLGKWPDTVNGAFTTAWRQR